MTVTKDNTAKLMQLVAKLTRREVLIGIPAENAAREEETGQYGDFNNAAIGFVNEFGSPSRNIPARPHLVPGVRAAVPKMIPLLKKAGAAVLGGDAKMIDKSLTAIGIVAVKSVQTTIIAGIPPGLATSTLRARLRMLITGTTPLIASAQICSI